MKRKLAFLMALVLVLAFSSSAMAFTQTDANGATTVTYTVSPSYTINIPADISTTDGIISTQTVSVAAGYIIGKAQTLTINVASTNGYKLQNGSANDAITYTVQSDGAVTPGNALDGSTNKQVLALVASEQTPVTSANLTFAIETATNAGTYSDTLTFTAALAG